MAGNQYTRQIVKLRKKQKQLYIILGVLATLLIVVIAFCSWKVVAVNKENKSLKAEKAQQVKYIKNLQENRVAKYSSATINHRAEIAKGQIDSFFYVINNWTGDNYASRYSRAKKYADTEIVNKYIGGGSQKDAEQQAENFKANKMTSKVISTNWYTEESNSSLVSGLYLIKTKVKVDGDKGTYSTQMFQVNYNLTEKKVISIDPVSIN